MLKRIFICLLAGGLASFVHAQNLELIPLEDVRLLKSPFKHAQDLNLAYIMAMDADKLAAPFLREAGLKPKKQSYGNWEDSGLDGHIGGHYLTALSLAYASTGDEQYRDRLDYFVSELKRAQDANGDGYLGGVPNSDALWKEIASGEIRADLFSLNERWVPWYNLHKTYAGLRDAWLLGENRDALGMLKRLGQWTIALTKNLGEKQIQDMLLAEHGGMNEVFADYYAITGNEKYLALARQFSERRILDPLLKNEDNLNGLHANTQIPKAVGFARVAQLADDQDWREAADFFWQVVANQRSVAIGGNSVREHFHAKDDFGSMIEEVEGPETCNTYNMLKLSALLYQHDADPDYVEFYERALYNHILASQHPQTGGLVYFTPMRPQHYRVYSQVDTSMWCCVGSGIENHLKYGEFIYAHKADDLYVNLFIPSHLYWREKDVILRQQTRLPDAESTRFTIDKGGRFSLNIRQPSWLAEAMQLRLNGKPIKGELKQGYLAITRGWSRGDVLEVSLPMRTRLEQLPDGSPWYAILHGPVVLSAPVSTNDEELEFFADDSRMGHIAEGKQCPLYEAPMLISQSPDVLDKIQRVPGDTLKFVAPDLIGNTEQKLTLLPFFRVHETRYMLYWQLGSQADIDAMLKEQEEKEKARMALEARTIDKVAPGEQQPEAEHNFKSEDSEAGVHLGRHWRHASGWFSYELKNPKGRAKVLRITYFGADAGRTFSIYANGELIKTVESEGSAGPVFVDVDYELPKKVRKAKTIEVKFEAAPNSVAGGIFGVRLLK